MTEYLFRNEELLNEVIDTAIEDNTFRSDDLEFTFAARVRAPLCSIVYFSDKMLVQQFLGPFAQVRMCCWYFSRFRLLTANEMFYRLGLTACLSVTSILTGTDLRKSSYTLSRAFQTQYG